MKKTGLLFAMVLGLFMLLTVTASVSYAMSQADEDLIRKIDGRRYTWLKPGYTSIIDVRGKTFVMGHEKNGSYYGVKSYEIRSRSTTYQMVNDPSEPPPWVEYCTYTISDDGERITARCRMSDGSEFERVFFWQR